jgi:Transglycosylase SLT domain
MHRFVRLMCGIARRKSIPLFVEKPSHPSVPLDYTLAIARSRGQGRSQTGACALPLTEASPVASCRRLGGGTRGIMALLLIAGLCAIATSSHNAWAEAARFEHQYSYRAYAAHIAEASQRFHIPAAWIRAVMRAESAGAQRAISLKGAMGLMQIMPDTWDELRVRYRLGKDPYDPRDNILAGAAYLRELHDRYGSPGFLAAYNAGPKRYEDYLSKKRPLPPETRAYVAALLPFFGGHSWNSPAIIATTTNKAQARSSLFASRETQLSMAAPEQPENHVDFDNTEPSARDISGIVPLSEGLFVASIKKVGQ